MGGWAKWRREQAAQIQAAAVDDPELMIDYDPRLMPPKERAEKIPRPPRYASRGTFMLDERESLRRELLRAVHAARRNDARRAKGKGGGDDAEPLRMA